MTSTSCDKVDWMWTPDEDATQCEICDTPFTFFRRRHHCRRCGRCAISYKPNANRRGAYRHRAPPAPPRYHPPKKKGTPSLPFSLYK